MSTESQHGLDDGRFLQGKRVERKEIVPNEVKSPQQIERNELVKGQGSTEKYTPYHPVYEYSLKERDPNHSINHLFVRRWSPREFSPAPVQETDLQILLEAARWAPSTYNEQEWRFLYAFRDTDSWPLFFEALAEANQKWCKNAGALICIAGKKKLTKSGEENPVRSFDCGAAFQNMALQAVESGMVVHGMAGFDTSVARKNLKIPDDYAIEAMVAIGHAPDKKSIQEVEADDASISSRKPISAISCEGRFSLE